MNFIILNRINFVCTIFFKTLIIIFSLMSHLYCTKTCAVALHNSYVTLLPCAVESHPTPGDIRVSSSPSRSISGVSSHVADGGSARMPLECVQPSLSRSSSPSRPIHSPEHHVIFYPSCSHHVPKVA